MKGLWPWSRRSQAIDDAAWAAMLDQLPGLAWLTPEQGRVLRQRAAELLSRKPIHAAPGLTLAPAMQLRIALLAALPVLVLGLAAYRNFYTFFVYPDDFLVEHEVVDEAGVVHRFTGPLAGQTSPQGAVILSWTAVEESGQGWGFNVVVHELAHKLDMLGGGGQGVPVLASAAWARAWERDFEALRAALADDPNPPLPAYAGTSLVECFAVCSEYLFDAPRQLWQLVPEIYRHLARFYRVDPLGRAGS